MIRWVLLTQLLLLYSSISSSDLLSNIDEMAYGFDAAKMLSMGLDKSLSKIFNFADMNSISPMIDVSDIKLLEKKYFESVSFTYLDFCSKYFQFISLGSLKLCEQHSLNIEHHEILKTIRAAINENNQAIGFSQIWWGLSSIRFASTNSLPFDSVFNQSFERITQFSAGATNEGEQIIFNEFIETFGTHLTTSAIVGGVINIYTFVDERDDLKQNYSEISYKISQLIENMKIRSNETHDQALSTSFTDLHTILSFKPNIESHGSKSDWSLWIQKTAEHPIIVNRTVVSIGILLADYPSVRSHLEQTISYYIRYGSLPTFSQLNSQTRESRRQVTLPKIPGLDIVGCGFNIFSVETKLCLVDISNTSKQNEYIDPFDSSFSYSLPNNFYAIDIPDLLELNFTTQGRTLHDYYQRTVSMSQSFNMGFLGFGASFSHTVITRIYRRIYEENYYFALQIQQLKWYTLSMIAFPYPKLNSLAQTAINKLPMKFNPNNTKIFQEFFSKFGTHFVHSADMGGLRQLETWYKSCWLYKLSQTWISQRALNFWWFFGSSTISSSYSSTVEEKFRKLSLFYFKVIGGNQTIDHKLFEDWKASIKLNPKPIHYRLKPIYTLLPEGQQRTSLADALHYLQSASDIDKQTYISQLKKDYPPPQEDCDLNRKKRQRRSSKSTNKKRNLTSNANAARLALCPIIGYNGSFCPGDEQNKEQTSRSLSSITRLHRAVGMTIDITTGKLMLPVLKLTYSPASNSNLWVDTRGTGKTFLIPNEIVLTQPIASKDNKPSAYIYPTPMQFADVWTRTGGPGSWLGGEFGHKKSVLNLNLNYFSQEQGTAITQYPVGLYRLEINNLTLNEYAIEALNMLPEAYNPNIYRDFMDIWGTHIAVSTLIGGMIEQQIIFKKCMLSALTAITAALFGDYMIDELQSNTTTNPFYAQRRQVVWNHRLGGNQMTADQSLWLKSISTNPALLKIDRYISWANVVTNSKIKKNLETAITSRLNESLRLREREQSQNQDSLGFGDISIHIGFTFPRFQWNGGSVCARVGPIRLNGTAFCSNTCSLNNAEFDAILGTQTKNIFTYERDKNTGSIRVRFNDFNNVDVIANSEIFGSGCIGIVSRTGISGFIYPIWVCTGCVLTDTHEGCSCPCTPY